MAESLILDAAALAIPLPEEEAEVVAVITGPVPVSEITVVEQKPDDKAVPCIIQALDFETVGFDPEWHPNAALGIDTLVNGQLTVIEEHKGYTPSVAARSEPRCEKEFWAQIPGLKEALAVPDVAVALTDVSTDGAVTSPVVDTTYYERQMVMRFVERTRANEKAARETGVPWSIVTDEAVFDITRIQRLISKFSPELLAAFPDLPAAHLAETGYPLVAWPQLSYSFLEPGKYNVNQVENVSDMLRATANAVKKDPNYPKRRKNGKPGRVPDKEVLAAVYKLPDPPESYSHTHRPHHDAYGIAWWRYILYLIEYDKVPKWSELKEQDEQRSRKRKLEELVGRLSPV